MKLTDIRNAILLLSCIARTRFCYDSTGKVFGDGPIHYLVEVGDLLLMAWEDNDTKNMIVNPIARFALHELGELDADELWDRIAGPSGPHSQH